MLLTHEMKGIVHNDLVHNPRSQGTAGSGGQQGSDGRGLALEKWIRCPEFDRLPSLDRHHEAVGELLRTDVKIAVDVGDQQRIADERDPHGVREPRGN